MNIDPTKSLDFYLSLDKVNPNRKRQAQSLVDVIDFSTLGRLEVIETGASQNFDDGCFGLFFAHMVTSHLGKMSSVDIDQTIVEKSQAVYESFFSPGYIIHSTADSLTFLKEYKGRPNLVHLDSWDLDIYNPEPSMLHGFLEFLAIKDKMDSGSYIVVDDNFLQGTIIYWDTFVNGEYQSTKEFLVNQEILGKGSMIYHYVKKEGSDWEIVGDHYQVGPNIKLVIKKK
jgi:hypothetical protein